MLTDIVKPAPVSSIDDVLSIMTAIDSSYLQVTRSVQQAVTGPVFRDARFMSKLDVVFANLYFAAIAAGDVDLAAGHRTLAGELTKWAEDEDHRPFGVKDIVDR